MTTVSRISHQNDTGLRVLNIFLRENLVLVVVLVLEFKKMHCKKRGKKRQCASGAHSFCKNKRIKSRFRKIVSTQLETKLDELKTSPLKLKFLSQLTNDVGESADVILTASF